VKLNILDTYSLAQKRIIQGGFIIILLLMLVSFSVSIIFLNNANNSITTIAKYNNQKIALAYAMRDSIRKRQIILSDMLSTKDPFARDEMYISFSQRALDYIVARDELLSLPMTEHEKALHEELANRIRIAQPLNRIAVEMLKQSINNVDRINNSILNARTAQAELLDIASELVAIQNRYANNAVSTSAKEFDFTITLILISALFITFVSGYIAYAISKIVGKKNQELLEKNQELEFATSCKNEFVANMSHEIRTPLTAIIGFSETMMLKDQTESERNDAVKTIIMSGNHLLQIVNDVLDLSKIEAHKIEYENINHNPFKLLDDIESVIKPQAIEKGLNFSVNIRFPMPKGICSDPLRIRQILLNLCSNALKFTGRGQIYINVSYDTETKTIRYDVTDTGIGIPREKLDTIFTPFEQAESSTTRKFGGTGLGLTLSSKLAEGLGGTLTAASIEGDGSRFTFSLPLTNASSELVHNNSDIPQSIKKDISSSLSQPVAGKILLAEDNTDNQKLITLYLSRMGLDVDIANNGLEALEKSKQQDYDLIFMDMRMPEMDGVTATSKIREHDNDTPIIALTANAMKSDQDQFYSAGCNGFLSKPIDITMLSNEISKFLTPSSKPVNQLEPVFSSVIERGDFDKLVMDFVNSLPNDIENALKIFESDNYPKLLDVFHNLKGVSGNYGFPEIVALIEKMEFNLLSENETELRKLFAELTALHKRMMLGLNKVK